MSNNCPVCGGPANNTKYLVPQTKNITKFVRFIFECWEGSYSDKNRVHNWKTKGGPHYWTKRFNLVKKESKK